MNIKAVIWDLDGTLLNTLDDLAASTNAALLANGLPARTTDEVRAFVGNGIHKLIERAVPETGAAHPLFQATLDAFVAHYGEHSKDHTKPYDGVIETLVVPKVNIITFARLVGAYSKGRYKEYPDLIWPRKDKEITFSSCDKRDVVVCVDGEIMRDHQFTVKLSEKKVNFFYPGDLSYERR